MAPELPTAADLTEAFLWSQYRTVTKTATVSLHSNTYQVEPALVGRKVELVFSPFNLEAIEVRHGGRSYYQWMARGEFLRERLIPLLARHLTAELDPEAHARFRAMRERYGV